ncbi:Hypothetical predicted protein [Marmota monax]|uniref:Uncharacterized protein n=1 Tax=Marmota monax TaxID=9995 RepID=A0A5E4BHM3_MARMO|nr:hypothetical protein GHT09_013506 [Marmota monax]VTJ68696.1 Hypothetical predicted protein [Marmota monax]
MKSLSPLPLTSVIEVCYSLSGSTSCADLRCVQGGSESPCGPGSWFPAVGSALTRMLQVGSPSTYSAPSLSPRAALPLPLGWISRSSCLLPRDPRLLLPVAGAMGSRCLALLSAVSVLLASSGSEAQTSREHQCWRLAVAALVLGAEVGGAGVVSSLLSSEMDTQKLPKSTFFWPAPLVHHRWPIPALPALKLLSATTAPTVFAETGSSTRGWGESSTHPTSSVMVNDCEVPFPPLVSDSCAAPGTNSEPIKNPGLLRRLMGEDTVFQGDLSPSPFDRESKCQSLAQGSFCLGLPGVWGLSSGLSAERWRDTQDLSQDPPGLKPFPAAGTLPPTPGPCCWMGFE